MFKSKTWLMLLVLAVAAVLVTACAPAEPEQVVVTVEVEGEGGETIVVTATPSPEQETATEEGAGEEAAAGQGELTTYQTGIYEDLTTTNYWAGLDTEASTWNFTVIDNYYPSLYTLAPQRFDFVPWLAEGLPGDRTEEGDFVTVEVKLQDGLTWTDGEPLTAGDVVFTLNTAQNFQLSGNWETYKPDLFDHAEAVDDTTVKYYFTGQPGLGEWEFGVAIVPILAEHYWAPIVEDAAAAAGLNDADPADEEAYAAASSEARAALYAYVPENEPVYGPMMFERWEPGAFAESTAREDFPQKGDVENLYEDGAYEMVTAGGESEVLYGEASGEPYLSVETGPFVPGVVFSIYGSQDAAVLALLDGEIDYIQNPNGLSTGLYEQVSGADGVVTVENPNYGFRYLAFNVRDDRPATSDVAFRQAVATVIDQDFITNQILQGSAIPMYTVMPEANRYWYNPDVKKWGFDDGGNKMDSAARLEAAIAILQDAGYSWEGGEPPMWNEDEQAADVSGALLMPDGTPVPEMTLLAPSAGYDPMRATSAIWIEQWMRGLGIPVTAELTGFNTIQDAVFTEGDATWDMYILGWGLGNRAYPTYFGPFWDCAYDAETTGGFNTPGYCNEEYDAAVAEFLAATDRETARDMVFQMQEMLANDVPYVTLFTTPLLEVYRDNVEFPYTDVLGGLQASYGFQGYVKAYTIE